MKQLSLFLNTNLAKPDCGHEIIITQKMNEAGKLTYFLTISFGDSPNPPQSYELFRGKVPPNPGVE